MPIHEKGYRHYEGARRGRLWRCITIASCGVRLALARRKLVALVLLGVTPAIVIAVLIYFSTQAGEFAQLAANMMDTVQEWREDLGDSPTLDRIWNTIFHLFFTFQVFPVAVIVAYVGPDLIAQDLRTRALQVYYARPLTTMDYLLGKLMVVGVFVAIVTLVPGLLLYIVGVVLSKSIAVVPQTWSTPVGIIGGYVVLALTTGSVALMCSSFTRRTGYAAMIWGAVVVLSDVGYALLRETLAVDWAYMLSLRANVLQTTGALLRVMMPYESDWFPSFFVLAAVVTVSWAVLLRRTAALKGEH